MSNLQILKKKHCDWTKKPSIKSYVDLTFKNNKIT